MLRDDNVTMLAFGPFTVDVVRRTVSRNGVPLRLTLRCVELLIAFARNPGKPLTKQQLLDEAWPDPEASDATLAQHVFLLRRALRHENIVWIKTIPNVGYCFTAEVRTVESEEDERSRALRAYMESASEFRRIGTERALRSAIDLCSHAITLDESNAAAYAMRAGCWRLLAESMHAEPLPCLQAARADAESALSRDAADADARIEAALSAALLERNAARAQRHLDAAQRLKPGHPALPPARVWVALIDGRTEDAVRIARGFGGALYGVALYMTRDFERARAIFECSAEVDAPARVMRGACRLFTGDAAGALEDFHAVYYGDDHAQGRTPSVRQYALGLYAYALAKCVDEKTARAHASELDALADMRYVSPMARAAAYLGLGDRDLAVQLVEEALQRFDPWSAYLAVDPLLDGLREHPRFSRLARSAA